MPLEYIIYETVSFLFSSLFKNIILKDLAWPDDLPVPRGNLDRYEGSRFGTLTTLRDLRSEDEWDGYSWPDILRFRNLTNESVNDDTNPNRGDLFHKLI